MMLLMMQREIVRTLQVAFPGMEQSMKKVVLIVNSDCHADMAASFTRVTACLLFL